MVTSALVPGERDGAVTRPVAPAAVALAAVLPAVLYVHVFLAFPTNGRLIVEIADDGCGGPSSTGGSGLRGLADRVEAPDGRLRVDSPEGGGTRVRAEIPCA